MMGTTTGENNASILSSPSVCKGTPAASGAAKFRFDYLSGSLIVLPAFNFKRTGFSRMRSFALRGAIKV
jgi:hypothetical protein